MFFKHSIRTPNKGNTDWSLSMLHFSPWLVLTVLKKVIRNFPLISYFFVGNLISLWETTTRSRADKRLLFEYFLLAHNILILHSSTKPSDCGCTGCTCLKPALVFVMNLMCQKQKATKLLKFSIVLLFLEWFLL